ncbi:PRTase ComF-like protein [Ampelomyces quisqualis]|uniref:PRTase ComF-like protein n=1 Tax=Ampelomyces quisqualis TaxID=50730 RepID=A0A6A5QMJ9_AMPQU|nr:PRTase ComF-like protein [Ampelomyces quisqualis]
MPTVAVAKPIETDLKVPPWAVEMLLSKALPSRTAQDSMVYDVFPLHKIAGGDDVKFPFSVKDYQRYVFGDAKLAHKFGTDLARAFIACGQRGPTPSSKSATSNQNLTNEVAVAVVSGYAPTATYNLRKHFTACINRHLIAHNARPARNIDIIGTKEGRAVRLDPQASRTDAHHIDGVFLGNRTLIVLGDIRMCKDQEDAIIDSLGTLKIGNKVVFAYLASLDESTNPGSLSSTLSSIVSPSLKDVENIAQSAHFSMTEAFARFVLGRDYAEFCRFLRGQDDVLARLLLDYAIGGGYYEEDMYKDNFSFLLWEVDARESV